MNDEKGCDDLPIQGGNQLLIQKNRAREQATCASPSTCMDALANGLPTAYGTRYNNEHIENTAALSTITVAKPA